MIYYFKLIIAIIFPWITLLLHDNPGGAVVALIMQATAIGWPFAAAWAVRLERSALKKQKEAKAKSKD